MFYRARTTRLTNFISTAGSGGGGFEAAKPSVIATPQLEKRDDQRASSSPRWSTATIPRSMMRSICLRDPVSSKSTAKKTISSRGSEGTNDGAGAASSAAADGGLSVKTGAEAETPKRKKLGRKKSVTRTPVSAARVAPDDGDSDADAGAEASKVTEEREADAAEPKPEPAQETPEPAQETPKPKKKLLRKKKKD